MRFLLGKDGSAVRMGGGSNEPSLAVMSQVLSSSQAITPWAEIRPRSLWCMALLLNI